MIYLLGGRKNPVVRVVIGALVLLAGIVIHGGAILIAVGAVLVIWGAAATLKKYRIAHEAPVASDGRVS